MKYQLLLSVTVLILSSCDLFRSSNTPPVDPVSAKFQALVDTLMPQIEAARGLSYSRPVYARSVTTEQMMTMLRSMPQEAEDPEETLYFTREFYQLGFVTDSTYNLDQEQEDLQSEAVAGFYIPQTDTFYIINNTTELTEDEWQEFREVAHHELVHALQDQNFDPWGVEITHSSMNANVQVDFITAQNMLIEGGAEYLTMMFTGNQSNIPTYKTAAFDMPFLLTKIDTNDLYLNYVMLSAYMIGPAYISHLYSLSNDWSAVNAKWASRELTSAEVITNSEVLYHQFPSDAVRGLVFTDPKAYTEDVTLGVINIIGMLKEKVSVSDAELALGWKGDHLFYTNNNPATDGQFLWCFAFKSSSFALNFAAILEQHILGRSNWRSESEKSYPGTASYKVFSHGTLTCSMVIHQNCVYWIENLQSNEDLLLDILVNKREPPLSKKAMMKKRTYTPSLWTEEKVFRHVQETIKQRQQ